MAAEKLREQAEAKAEKMVKENPGRKPMIEKLEELVAAYNAASIDAERFFAELKDFVRSLDEEEERAARAGLNQSELAIFDLLTNPEPKLTKAQETEVMAVAKRLLERLTELVEAVDWQRGQETRGAVWTELRMQLNHLPEEPYPETLWNAKVNQVWEFLQVRY